MKITNRKIVEEALVRIEELHQHIQNVENAQWYLRHRKPHVAIDSGRLRSDLIAEELDEWRNVFMWALTLTTDEQERIKAAAHSRFLRDGTCVAHWLNNGIAPSGWLTADEDRFREMARKAFGGGGEG